MNDPIFKSCRNAERIQAFSEIVYAFERVQRKDLIGDAVMKVLDRVYELGHDDGVELMRDPAYSQEHV